MKKTLLSLAALCALTLTCAARGAEVTATCAIDAAKQGAPISPYIYGQFIEHLGKCIYGGIWAEMLQDRKFYDAPNAKGSPWRLFGGVRFEQAKAGAFAGEASPKWTADADDAVFGVTQKGLEFVKDKGYVGYVWAKLAAGQTLAVEVNLGGKETIVLPLTDPAETAADGYAKYAFTFDAASLTAPKGTGSISVKFTGKGEARLGTLSVMPSDNISGMRADTIALLQELNAPIYRWPGGNFVSGYDWKDGIGDRDRRPPRKNPAWTGIEHNDFGMDEFMVFCELVGCEPDVAVNTGAGEVASALEELEYANGSSETTWGKVRAMNGHEEPYAVKTWCIGNEMFGDWQIGHMATDKYAVKNNAFVDGFRAFDPNLTLISVGAVGDWDELILRECADHMDWLSEHFYVQERADVIEHVELIPNAIRHVANAHRHYRETIPQLKGKDIRIAMDEWNYWYGPHLFGELGTRYFHKDGLGIAEGLHEYYRNSDIFVMANYAQTVNVIGCVKTSQTSAQFETTGLVLKLYRNEYGTIPLKVDAQRPYDVAAALTEDEKTLTVAIVNPTTDAVTFNLTVDGLSLANDVRRFEIADDNPMAFNDPDFEQRIDITESTTTDFNPAAVSVKPLSVTLFRVPVK